MRRFVNKKPGFQLEPGFLLCAVEDCLIRLICAPAGVSKELNILDDTASPGTAKTRVSYGKATQMPEEAATTMFMADHVAGRQTNWRIVLR